MKYKLLRITTVTHSLDLLLKGQLEYIGKRGFDISIACTKDSAIEKIEIREDVKYYELKLLRTINPIQDLFSLLKAIRLIYKLKPDIVHTHSPKAGIIGMLASCFCKVSLKIHTVAGLPLMEAEGFKKKLLIEVERLTYYCADYILPNSVRQKEFIEKHIYKGEKLKVIGRGSSNGIDLKYFDPDLLSPEEVVQYKEKLGIPTDNIVLCFVGRLANYKGVNELIEAFIDLNDKYNILTLLLVGPFEDLNPLKQSTLREIKFNNSIISVGHQDDIRTFLLMSEIFIFPSYREGFPQALMQAAAMRLACIASDINGCNEIIEDGNTGLLIEIKNKEAIINAVERLLFDSALRIRLSNNARKLMEKHFEQNFFWDKIIHFYKTNLK